VLLTRAEVPVDLEDRVRRRRADLEMAARLEDVRLLHMPIGGVRVGEAAADPAYQDAFRAYGIDVPGPDPEQAASRMRASTIPVQLAAALDDWALVCRQTRDKGDATWERLLDLARAVDPDRWRNDLRIALERRDSKALETLANSANVTGLSPSTLVLLGHALAREKSPGRAVGLLRRAQLYHPDDFGINVELADCYVLLDPPLYDDALRYRSIALALRPDSPTLLRIVGHHLRWKGAADEGIAAIRRAISLKPDYAEAHFNLGTALQIKGSLGEAIKEFRAAIRLWPPGAAHGKDYLDAHHNLGLA
jgi:tetratricopeptide (TPR) repeat protein